MGCSGTCQPDIHIARPSCYGKEICKKPEVPSRITNGWATCLFRLGHPSILVNIFADSYKHAARTFQEAGLSRQWHSLVVGQSANRGSMQRNGLHLPAGCLLYERCHGIQLARSEDGERLVASLYSMNLRSAGKLSCSWVRSARCSAILRLEPEAMN